MRNELTTHVVARVLFAGVCVRLFMSLRSGLLWMTVISAGPQWLIRRPGSWLRVARLDQILWFVLPLFVFIVLDLALLWFLWRYLNRGKVTRRAPVAVSPTTEHLE